MRALWNLTETEFDAASVPKNESLFAVGNGYLGIRGCHEEKEGYYSRGTYIGGFYDTEPMTYAENAYGYARERQRLLPIADGTELQLTIDGVPLDLSRGGILDYRRELQFRGGLLSRNLEWESPAAGRIVFSTQRLVSFTRPHIAAIRVSIDAGKSAALTLESSLVQPTSMITDDDDPRVGGLFKEEPLLLYDESLQNGTGFVWYRTRHSGMEYICILDHLVSDGGGTLIADTIDGGDLRSSWRIHPESGTVEIVKWLAYFTGKDLSAAPNQDLKQRALDELGRAKEAGFHRLKEEQREYLKRFWAVSDIRIQGDDRTQRSVRFCIFHLLQAAGRTDYSNIGVKGLTGHGYDGHYFWDTEIYMLPMFIYTMPEMAGQILKYRYATLPQARKRAARLDHPGALYPWRTLNGNEASAYFPAGTAQYHINADIVYTIKRYIKAAGDFDFLHRYGAEIVFENARFWSDFGDTIPGKGFCLNCVTGPDEYTALVNNNTFTNCMVRDNLEYAVEIAEYLRTGHPDIFTDLSARLNLGEAEIEAWRKAAASIYLPQEMTDGSGRVVPQDDSFFEKGVWDFETTPKENYPLLLHYHPLNIYRKQVLKQPDLVLALLLQSRRFSREAKKCSFDYYEALTTGDSSLSAGVQAIIAAELGYDDRAYAYFTENLSIDLEDSHDNTKYGLHAAALGSTWLALICGFAGLRDDGGAPVFAPNLPKQWSSMEFSLLIKNNLLQVGMARDTTRYTLKRGSGLHFFHREEKVNLQSGQSIIKP